MKENHSKSRAEEYILKNKDKIKEIRKKNDRCHEYTGKLKDIAVFCIK